MLGVLALARRTGLPYPVLLVAVGLGLGSLPGMPRLEPDPDVFLLGILPPLLFWPAFLASPREMREHATAIGALAIALVLATSAAVAAFAHLSGPAGGEAKAMTAATVNISSGAFCD